MKGIQYRTRIAIGKRMVRARTAAKLSVRAAAEACSVGHWTWLRWEAGTSSVPAEFIPLIAKAVGTTVDALLGLRRPAGVAPDQAAA